MPDQPIVAQVKKITPQTARELLDSQSVNRKWRRDVVDRYKTAMLSGEWFVNGEPIIIDERGRLIDGQHRLMALIEANKAIDMIVMTGIKTGLEKTINMGKSRTMGDVFQMSGVRNARLLSRTSKLLLIWNTKFEELIKKQGFTREITNIPIQRIYDFYLEKKQDIDRACGDFKKNTPLITNTGSAVLSFVFAVLEKINPDRCYAFMTSYTTGNIKKEWPYMVKIRDHFLARVPKGHIRITEGERISILFGLWNVIYHGKAIEEVESTALNIPVECQ